MLGNVGWMAVSKLQGKVAICVQQHRQPEMCLCCPAMTLRWGLPREAPSSHLHCSSAIYTACTCIVVAGAPGTVHEDMHTGRKCREVHVSSVGCSCVLCTASRLDMAIPVQHAQCIIHHNVCDGTVPMHDHTSCHAAFTPPGLRAACCFTIH